MDITLGFLTYVAVFRLSIIVVGAIAIFLGYRLFIKDPVGHGRATAIAEGGGFKLTLQNFWPGTFFAVFGSAIIGIMLWQGNPELSIKELQSPGATVGEASKPDSKHIVLREVDRVGDIDQLWEALSDPVLPLVQAAGPISRIAEIWQKEQRAAEALAMARLAARIDPENAEYLALFAELLFENGEVNEALRAMEKAAKLDSRYQPGLSELQRRLSK